MPDHPAPLSPPQPFGRDQAENSVVVAETAAGPGVSSPSLHDHRPTLAERRQHPAYLVISAGKSIRGALPALVGLAVWGRYWWLFVIVGVLIAGGALLGWWTTRYSVADGVLRLRSGYFTKSEQTVPIHRITGVDARRGVVQRLFGVWEVGVQTPGDGEKATITLSCLSQSALDALRATLAATGAARGGPAPTTTSVLVGRLSSRRLLLAAATGASLPLMLAGLGVIWNRVEEFLPRDLRRQVRDLLFSPARLLLVIPAVLLLALLVAVLLAALRQAKFTVYRDADRLRFSRGLLSQRVGTVMVDRVQAVRVVEGALRLPFGWCSVELEVAGVSDDKGSERTLFPILRRSEVAALVHTALPELGWIEPEPLAGRLRRRYATLPVLVGLAATAGALLLPSPWTWSGPVALVVAVSVGLAQMRAAAVGVDGRVLALRWHRVLTRHTLVARTRRVQLTQVTTTWPQRRSGVAGLRVKLSSGRSGRVRHLPVGQADDLLHSVGRLTRHTAAPDSPCPHP